MKKSKNKVAEQDLADVSTGGRRSLRSLIGRLVGIGQGGDTPHGDGTAESATHKRREKRPLQRELPPAEPYPVDALGPILGDAARALEEAIQAPMAICGSSVLAVAHLATQPFADVIVDGRRSPLSGFFVTVGSSGERKTAVDNVALLELRLHEKRLAEQHSKAMRLLDQERAAAKRGPSKGGGAAKSDDHDEASGGGSTLPPLSPIIFCEEPTMEGLFKNLSYGQPSQGIFTDEGGRFLNGYSMSSEHTTATCAGLSKLWDGKSIDRVRGGDGASKLYGRRVSFHLMAQPQVAAILMANPLAQDQGFLSRCLITMPPSTIGGRMYREIDLTTSVAMVRFHAQIRDLLARRPPVEDPDDFLKRSQLAPRALSLEGDAKRAYIEFHDEIERAMRGEVSEFRAFWNKGPEHLLRIAGVLAIFANADTSEISVTDVENARNLVRYYLGEARRIDQFAREDQDLQTAQKLLEWMQELRRPVSLVEIYQRGPSHMRDARSARHFVRVLTDHGYLVPQKGVIYRGLPRDEGWKLTP